MSRPPAILLGAHHASALAVIRSLGAAGVAIVAVDERADAIGFHSRWVGTRHVAADRAAVLAFLRGLAARHRGGVLIPTSDRYVALVAQHAATLAPALVPAVPAWDVLGPLMRKPECYELARAVGLRPPRYWAVDDEAGLGRALAALDGTAHEYLLAIADPTIAEPVADPATGRAVLVGGRDPRTIGEAARAIRARTGHFPMVVEVVPGPSEAAIGVTLVVDREQRIVQAHGLRRLPFRLLRSEGFVHPYAHGWNVRCESARDDEAFAAAAALVRHAGYFGVITVEFRRDARDGGLVFVKVDPRVERATALSGAIGLDVPRALYAVFTEAPLAPPASFPTGVRWFWLTWGLTTLWNNRHRVALGRELATLARELPRTRAFAIASLRDPRPFAVDLGRWLRTWTRRGGAWARRRLGGAGG